MPFATWAHKVCNVHPGPVAVDARHVSVGEHAEEKAPVYSRRMWSFVKQQLASG